MGGQVPTACPGKSAICLPPSDASAAFAASRFLYFMNPKLHHHTLFTVLPGRPEALLHFHKIEVRCICFCGSVSKDSPPCSSMSTSHQLSRVFLLPGRWHGTSCDLGCTLPGSQLHVVRLQGTA